MHKKGRLWAMMERWNGWFGGQSGASVPTSECDENRKRAVEGASPYNSSTASGSPSLAREGKDG